MEYTQQEENNVALIEEKSADAAPSAIDQLLLEELVRVGVVFGRRSSKTNPRMEQFIEFSRNGIELFDHAAILAALRRAGDFLEGVVQKRGVILFVGTMPSVKDLVGKLAHTHQFPRVTERWIGGTLTNFQTIAKRIAYYLKLKADYDAGRLDKYTKKERVQFAKQIERMTHLFDGLETLTALPQALFIVNLNAHLIAVREARRLGIPVVAIANSDANPDLVEYPIPGNDTARSAVAWLLAKIEERIVRGRAAGAGAAPAEGPNQTPIKTHGE